MLSCYLLCDATAWTTEFRSGVVDRDENHEANVVSYPLAFWRACLSVTAT